MHVVITGVAGFIGSTLAESVLADGHTVVGIDCFTDYYPVSIKRENIAGIVNHPAFQLTACDLRNPEAARAVLDAEVVFHLAGQPGVRSSWGEDFAHHVDRNIHTTQTLLELIRNSRSLRRFVYASSSSVYGDATHLPLAESAKPSPVSPYGITKLTAEHLCAAYSRTYDIPVACLRYFTVYGPRQRPDMAFHRFFRACNTDRRVRVFGDGNQTRDFTYVNDAVTATKQAAYADLPERFVVINVGSGRSIPLNGILEMIREIAGVPLAVDYTPPEKGDMRDTFADISRAETLLSYAPAMPLADGLAEEYRWVTSNLDLLNA